MFLLRIFFGLNDRKGFQLLSQLLSLSWFLFLSSLSLQFLFCILQTLFELLWILRISEVGCKQLRLWALINKVSICISDSGAVAANIRPQLHRQCTVEGGIYLQGLVPPCEKMDGPFLLLLQELYINGALLLLFWEVIP